MKIVTIFTDGACKGNPGPGGWAAVMVYEEYEREIFGHCELTTNNRMELEAAIQALGSLKESCFVKLYTDSAYLENGVSKWLTVWKNRDWTTNGGHNVRNADLWKKLDFLASSHKVQVFRIKGHANIPKNIRCDKLAKTAAKSPQKAVAS